MNEEVVFWKWVNNSMLGLVTERSVYHWSIENDGPPVKVFERHSNLNGSQIINYRVNKQGNWMMLIGISAQVFIFFNIYI
jgi:clathrin heavy chain